mgnify:CR=1 FL=1
MNEKFLIEKLQKYNNIKVSKNLSSYEQIRALMNVTLPLNLSEEFFVKQDEYLKDLQKQKEIVDVEDILKDKQIALHLGDITTIKADAIVNACNSSLLGCFVLLHDCIDNAIHSAAGLQVRRDLIKELNGKEELNGQCRVTNGYNLPSTYIFHTVGPIVDGKVSEQDKEDLRNCYLSCLRKADEMKLRNIVFCSISTGLYSFPIKEACKIAVKTVKNYLKITNSSIKIVFDLFSKEDFLIYERELSSENK